MKPKEMKRFLILTAVFIMALSISASAKPDYYKLYGKLLQKTAYTYKIKTFFGTTSEERLLLNFESYDVSKGKYLAPNDQYRFAIFDLDGNGVKELLVRYNNPGGGSASHVFVFTIRKNKVKFVACQPCFHSPRGNISISQNKNIRVNTKKHAIINSHTESGTTYSQIYIYKNGKIRMLNALYGSDNVEVWTPDNHRIEYETDTQRKKAYNTLYNNYVKKGCKNLKLYKNTAKNRKKYLK